MEWDVTGPVAQDQVPDMWSCTHCVWEQKLVKCWTAIQQNQKGSLCILHGLEKLNHYCFATEVYLITDYKPLVAIVSKDEVTLSQWLQCIMLHIHQYSVFILHRPGPILYIADWLSHNNHTHNRDQDIMDMNVTMYVLNTAGGITICPSIKNMQAATSQDLDLERLKTYIIKDWPHTNDEVEHSTQIYWPIRHELVIISY